MNVKPEQTRYVSFIIMTSDRNASVTILNHWDSFLPDISASFLKVIMLNFRRLQMSHMIRVTISLNVIIMDRLGSIS